MRFFRRSRFTGSNNIAKPERLPMEEGAGPVVDAVNMDFTVGGKMELRTGFEPVLERDDVRALFAMGDSLALVAGDTLFRVSDDAAVELATVSPGPVAAAYHNGELLLNTLNQSMRIRGTRVSPWAVPAPEFSVTTGQGSLPAGIYRIAVTAVDGVESGSIETAITLGEGQSIVVNVDDPRECRLYCSVANGTTLYHQGRAYATNVIGSIQDDSARAETVGLAPLPFCRMLESHKGMIFGADGHHLYHTRPMLPHLHNPEFDFFSYPEPITMIASVAGGLFVAADRTYFLTGVSGGELSQREVVEFGAVEGTATRLPDGSVAWFSRYGQVIGRADGSIDQLNRASYSPDIAQHGAAGLLEHNGNQMVVTTMRGETQGSTLRAGDYWNIEVLDNE